MTLDEIAMELGMSKSTVSRALSGKGRVSEKTKARIKSFVQDNRVREIQINNSAKTQCIGVAVPADALSANIPYFQECLLGICESATMMNYSVVITTVGLNDISGIQKLVESGKVDAIILMRSVEDDKALKYLTDINFPTGLTGVCDYKEVIQVDTDIRQAAESLTNILISSGYTRFAMIAGNTHYYVNRNRCEGYFDALKRNGIPAERQVYYQNFENTELVDNIISDIIMNKTECVVCGDDTICTVLMSKLQSEGYRIPKDISIVSLFNSATLGCFSSPVTAINISAKKVGNTMAKQIINYLQGNEYNLKTMTDYEILFRASTNKIYRM